MQSSGCDIESNASSITRTLKKSQEPAYDLRRAEVGTPAELPDATVRPVA